VGFRFESEENGGRLAWLPNVRGPKIIAATNGRYYDEPARSLDNPAPAFAGSENLSAPGTFEFQLTDHASVLIFSTEGRAKTQHAQYVGAFLASLIRNDTASKSLFVAVPSRNPLLLCRSSMNR
jgi:hypothetical protein